MTGHKKKRGSYKKHKPRRYPTQFKTTTRLGKLEYQRQYMRNLLGVKPDRYGKRGPKPKVVYVKDLEKLARKAKLVS